MTKMAGYPGDDGNPKATPSTVKSGLNERVNVLDVAEP